MIHIAAIVKGSDVDYRPDEIGERSTQLGQDRLKIAYGQARLSPRVANPENLVLIPAPHCREPDRASGCFHYCRVRGRKSVKSSGRGLVVADQLSVRLPFPKTRLTASVRDCTPNRA